MLYSKDASGEFNHDGSEPIIKPAALTYVVGAGSDPGKRKSANEDSIFAASGTWGMPNVPFSFGLFVVADGLGMYANGQDASCGAIQAMVNHIWPKVASGNAFQEETYPTLLTEAVQLANEAVRQQNIPLQAKDVDFGVMTTVATVMVVGSTAYVANVGDSRTYLYRASEGLKKITTDHLWVARQVEAGILKPDDIYTHPHRNVIERSLRWELHVKVDLFTVPLQLGDTLLLCSAGLWNMIRDPKIEGILSHTSFNPSKAADELIQAALDEGGKDNVSVIVVSLAEEQNRALMADVQLFAKPDSLYLPQG